MSLKEIGQEYLWERGHVVESEEDFEHVHLLEIGRDVSQSVYLEAIVELMLQ
jgi:hypothetical protein